MSDGVVERQSGDAVTQYKSILKRVLDNRPSGTRQRLANALGKNRSFVSQIANPTYPVPIPAQHVETIFEICHFSQEERRAFLEAYRAAHPRRLALVSAAKRTRTVAITLPDLGDAKRNRAIDELVTEMARRISLLAEDWE